MPVFIVVAILAFFLGFGALLFVLWAPMHWSRHMALSAALWGAAWGPCVLAWLLVAGLASISEAAVAEHFPLRHSHILALHGTLTAVALLTSTAVVSGLAVVHQWLIHRMTWALFRLYAAAVSGGLGSVFGWWIGLWLAFQSTWPLRLRWAAWLILMFTFVIVFALVAWRHARLLRGAAPERFTWLSRQEFEGSHHPSS